MSKYPLNQPIRLSTTVKDVTGTLVDAGALTLLVKRSQADGTLLTTGTYSSPAHDGTGLYHVDIPVTDLAVLGHYQFTWTSTGTGAGVAPGEFDVYDPWETSVISSQDAKAQLNMDPAIHAFDDELRDFTAAAVTAAEDYKHEVIIRRAVTDTLDLWNQSGYGYGSGYGQRRQQKFWVRSVPVISLTSVVAWDGTFTWDVTQMRASPTGLVRVMGGIPVSGLADVTYAAGMQVVPANYTRGILVILQHLWETQRGPGTVASGVIGTEEHWRQPGEFFSVPDKAKELQGPPRPVYA